MKRLVLAIIILIPSAASSQQYAIDSSKIAGGGGTSAAADRWRLRAAANLAGGRRGPFWLPPQALGFYVRAKSSRRWRWICLRHSSITFACSA
jgi:hypothetical protein